MCGVLENTFNPFNFVKSWDSPNSLHLLVSELTRLFSRQVNFRISEFVSHNYLPAFLNNL